ncbi:MAG: hypothetical protein Q9191_007131 [Dirinaria sp. TL-2023a]
MLVTGYSSSAAGSETAAVDTAKRAKVISDKVNADPKKPPSPASKILASRHGGVDHQGCQSVKEQIPPPLLLPWTAETFTDQSAHRSTLNELQGPGMSMNGPFDGFGEGFEPVSTGFFDQEGSIPADFAIDLSPLKIPSSTPSNTTPISFAVPGPIQAGDLQQYPNYFRPGSSESLAPEMSISSAPALAILSANPSMQASCQCLTSALSLLETLTIESARLSALSIARILHFKKRALMQCNILLDCERCSSVSSFIMLLVVFCEKMITSYERVLIVLKEQYLFRQGQQLDTSFASFEGDEESQMVLKDYDLDMEEQPCVFEGLASMQMRKLKKFLARVKAVLEQRNCEPHVMTVDSVEERLQQKLKLCDKRSNEH